MRLSQHYVTPEPIIEMSFDIMQMAAVANKKLLKESKISQREQCKQFKKQGIRLSQSILYRMEHRKRFFLIGVNTIRLAGLCFYWRLSLTELLSIGKEELSGNLNQ
jgi:hypothetical protein